MAINSSPKKEGKMGMDSNTTTMDSDPNAEDSSPNEAAFVCFCCMLCCLLPFMLLWCLINHVLSLTTANGSQVKASITDLYAPVITYNSATNFLTIPSIFFALSLYDDTTFLDICYDDITLKFYYMGSTINTSEVPIAEYTWPGFHQKYGTYAPYYDHVKTEGIYLEEVAKNASKIVLRVNLETTVRFQSSLWKGKKHKLLVRCDVRLSTITGKLVEKESLELKPYTDHGSAGSYGIARMFSDSYNILVDVIGFCLKAAAESRT